jgi:3-phosphoshikimate 1-carboxyvinyltransferase
MLPQLIEIKPLSGPVNAEITVPGSKSITNRALILAALAHGRVTLNGALWSEDTQVMVDCLQKLGFAIEVASDPNEFCNRTITVDGLGGKIPNEGDPSKPVELFVGNAGTAARFLAAFVCLGNGTYRLHGVTRMHERPQAALFKALRELGYRVESENGNDKLPVTIHGSSSRCEEALTIGAENSQSLLTSAAARKCTVSIEESSQFASALLLSSKIGGWKIEVVGENAEESPYVAMTSRLMDVFPSQGGNFQIEPDASSGSYFWAADWLIPEGAGKLFKFTNVKSEISNKGEMVLQPVYSVSVIHWPDSNWQIDQNFPRYLPPVGRIISRQSDLGDSIMTAITLAPVSALTNVSARFTDLGRLRLQECERVVALRTELTKCGANVVEEGDTLIVRPAPLHGAEIETYNDHRMAMCFAILGLKVPGIKIRNPACVKKTFPNFFQKLAAKPPTGLGAVIVDASTGKTLSHEELFAD